MRRCNNAARAAALAAAAALLGACADTYSTYNDHRETISLAAGNAVATNRVTQMVDPWPRASEDKNIAFNGEKMQGAVERYRKNRVIQPRGIGTGTSYQAAPSADPAAAASAAPAAAAPPPAPVK